MAFYRVSNGSRLGPAIGENDRESFHVGDWVAGEDLGATTGYFDRWTLAKGKRFFEAALVLCPAPASFERILELYTKLVSRDW